MQPGRILITCALASSIALSAIAYADEAPAPEQHASKWCQQNPEACQHFKERWEKRCQENPQRCEERKQKMQKMREECEKDPEPCKARREEMRKKMQERMEKWKQHCQADPGKCEMKKQPGDGQQEKPQPGNASPIPRQAPETTR
ncbi:MAG: hypothetical protein JSR19_05870 [Proteobacteria bacterium]|nr:hypothetical protein [Pseudomonadota bacterium]HQR03753.1 hypothetical protein [Rhodocyclaceae bacterium]